MIKLRAVRILPALVFLLTPLSIQSGPFEQGSKSLSVVLGAGQAFNDNYTIVGAGFGYYVLDGLELGIDVETWLGGEPSINKLSPQIRYVFTGSRELRPYIGTFFRKTSIDGFVDLDSTGGRVGLIFSGGRGYHLGAGLVFENYLDCNDTIFTSCSDTYTELSFTFLL